MNRRACLRRAFVACGVFAVIGVSGAGQVQPASAMTSFAVVGKVTGIDAGMAPPATFMPPVIVPIGDDVDGEHHRVVIEDDGGMHVARG